MSAPPAAPKKCYDVPELLLTPVEAADTLRATPRQVRRWMDERKLRFVERPRGRVIPVSAISEFVESRMVDRDA